MDGGGRVSGFGSAAIKLFYGQLMFLHIFKSILSFTTTSSGIIQR